MSDAIDFAVAVPSLIGSLVSAVGAGFIVLSYGIFRLELDHFRHKLILNLAVADIVIGLNNSVSGISIIARRQDMSDGPWCKANGFFAQLATQSVDFSILMIASAVVYVVRHPLSVRAKLSPLATGTLIVLPWILPLVTSTIASSRNLIHPVSGNWCWIQADPPYLRYLLMHGWRLIIILAVITMGIYANGRAKMLSYSSTPRSGSLPLSEVRQVLFLSSYPMYYVVLWLPGVANRLAEATGHQIRWLNILQASTQFVGLANAVTFGWHEVRHKFSLQKVLEMLLGFMLGD